MKRQETRAPGIALIFLVWALCFAFLDEAPSVIAQSNVSRVAVLASGTAFSPVVEGLREGLAYLGYEEGSNLIIVVEKTEGTAHEIANRVAKLVAAKPDVLFSIGTIPTVAANQATSTVPIVFAWVGEPVREGLITRYTSSARNVTGVASSSAPLSSRRLELLKEIAPGVKRVLTIVAVNDRVAEASFLALSERAGLLGVKLIRQDAATKEEAEKIIVGTAKGSVDAIYYIPSAVVEANAGLLIKKAKEERVPLIVHEEIWVEKGALVSYGVDLKRVGVQAATLVVRILKGAKPSQIPAETPQKLVLAVNLATAREIGLKIPPAVLERADRRVP
jgi:putative ABC transport system substrate-binding protein